MSDLSEDDWPRLKTWINQSEDDDWDWEKAVEFTPGGRSMAMGERAERNIAAGNTIEMEDYLALLERKRKLGKTFS